MRYAWEPIESQALLKAEIAGSAGLGRINKENVKNAWMPL
jgi:hypothetical protein